MKKTETNDYLNIKDGFLTVRHMEKLHELLGLHEMIVVPPWNGELLERNLK